MQGYALSEVYGKSVRLWLQFARDVQEKNDVLFVSNLDGVMWFVVTGLMLWFILPDLRLWARVSRILFAILITIWLALWTCMTLWESITVRRYLAVWNIMIFFSLFLLTWRNKLCCLNRWFSLHLQLCMVSLIKFRVLKTSSWSHWIRMEGLRYFSK